MKHLARTLRVSVAYLVGETDQPMLCIAGPGGAMPRIFYDHLQQRSAEVAPLITEMTMEQRFTFAVAFLCDRFPEQTSIGALAFHLRLSMQVLDSIIRDRHEIPFHALARLSQLTQIDMAFFSRGEISPTPDPRNDAGQAAMALYAEALIAAQQAGIRPALLTQFIKLIQRAAADGGSPL